MDERIERILKHPATIPVAVGVAAFASGFGAGFIFKKWQDSEKDVVIATVEQLTFEFESDDDGLLVPSVSEEEDSVEQIAAEFHETLRNRAQDERPDPADIQVDRATLAHIEKIVAEGGTPTYEDYERRNVFAASSTDDWDYDAELARRTEQEPYVIHKDEFYAEETGWPQCSLTYYAGDDILVDEDETPIVDYHLVVGELKFGHGSTDPTVFFVRNDGLMIEYEITTTDMSYEAEILGIMQEHEYDPDDIQHSLRKARGRMRREEMED